jgi:hypothetical protein
MKMTATRFFQLITANRRELGGIIWTYHPNGKESGYGSPIYRLDCARSERNYQAACQIILETRNQIPKDNAEYDLLCEFLEIPKEIKVVKKYYVGAEHIAIQVAENKQDGHIYSTLEEATKEAVVRVREGNRDCMIVVEIKRIVKRANPTPPIAIEEV